MKMKKSNKKFKKRNSNSLSKLSLFQKSDGKFSKKCPLSNKNAPTIDYKNISLLKKYTSENGKIISSKITSVSFNKQKKLTKEIKKAKILGLIQMEIILLENILNLGNIGDKVKVKNGYGRNFLLKQGKALRFNKENQDLVNKKKDELNKKNTELKNKYKEIAKQVNNKTFIFNKESKENGDLYGSIKPKEITNLIKETIKAEVSPSQLILKDELNQIGIFKVDINFHSEVKAIISIKIDKIQSK